MENEDGVTVEDIDNARKDCNRLCDKAIKQYNIAKVMESKSRIKSDGSGTVPITKGASKFYRDEDYEINPLSLTNKTFIASGMFSFVVRLKSRYVKK